VDQKEVPRERLGLRERPELLSPPWLDQPWQCATSVTVHGFEPHASIELEVAGVPLPSKTVGYPEPVGETLTLPAALVAGQLVRARQIVGSAKSDWFATTALDHTKAFPVGPPRPVIDPAPVFRCGIRTGVANLLAGGNVWITANGSKVGEVKGCSTHQGINVAPAYGPSQHVRAWFEICKDPSPPSKDETTQNPPAPLPAPGFDAVNEPGEQISINTIVNGAAVTVLRNGVNLGTYGCWGGRLILAVSPKISAVDVFTATQQMCPGDPPSPPGTGKAIPCSSLGAPKIGPVQSGDTHITVTQCALGATIKVWVNGSHVASGPGPIVPLGGTVLKLGDTIHVVQDLFNCKGQTALEVKVACVDPPTTGNPAWLNLFPVGHADYSDGGGVKGTVYYPAEDDGKDQAFNKRVTRVGRAPIVFMAHGNHAASDPSYLGYDYFQADLAKMGIIAVSVDCNALNSGGGGGLQNIEDRADLIIDSIKHFQALDGDLTSQFFHRIDFKRTGLMGHSRGGDAVVTVATVIAVPGITIRGVLALAPTNARFIFGLSMNRPKGYAFMTVLPASDGDLKENWGAQFYDQATPDPFKSQLYVHYANHNFFNRQWLQDDGVGMGPPVIPRAEHERILTSYGCAFFRSALLGHATETYLAGYEKPAGVLTQHVYLSFQKKGPTTVDNHEDRNGIGKNSLFLPTAMASGSANEFPFAQAPGGGPAPGAFNESFFGLTTGMVIRPGGISRVFRSEIGDIDLSKTEIWIRAAEVVARQGVVPDGASGFQLGVEDANGLTVFVDVDLVGGLPRPYPHTVFTKSMLNTIRFKADCFRAANRRVSITKVRALLIACNRRDERALAFDDLQVVKP
jgi:hypothetical protein